MRRDFEMTELQLAALLNAMAPVPYIIMGGMAPRSQQQNANDAWQALGKELGFVWDTVRPNGRGDRFFSAEAIEVPESTTAPEAKGLRMLTRREVEECWNEAPPTTEEFFAFAEVVERKFAAINNLPEPK